MMLTYDKNHPNGFKIYLASKIMDIKLDMKQNQNGTRCGAQLTSVNLEKLPSNFDPNSSVLKLFKNDLIMEELQWLDWEVTLQESLIPYLQCVNAGKEDRSLNDTIGSQLLYLNSLVPTDRHFFSEKLGPIDVILYSTLLPMLCNSKSCSLLKSNRELWQYLHFLRDQPIFKDSELAYFGSEGVTLNSWLASPSVVRSAKHSTWRLLKGQQQDSSPSPKAIQTSPSVDGKSPTGEERSVTEAEMREAQRCWEEEDNGTSCSASKCSSPILPVRGERNIMITSALPYVNNVPHLGNIIGCVLSADCFARFCRLRGDNIIYICGTDEYGTATETKALAEGCSPQQICDKYHAIHANVYSWFNIAFDYFGRTTTSSQTTAAQSIFWKLHENGVVSQNAVEQLYCSACERFLADRFVEGTCPFLGCGYEDARGDQCDSCGKLVNASELVKPRCKLCGKPPSLRSSTHLFLDLPHIENDLRQWMAESSPQWTSNARVICESWLRDGLRERCITRDLKWGTPVPLEGFTSKVFYVWFDAPIGYISITMEYTSEWQRWWKDPQEVTYYQFMAKDNVPFHGVIFPSCQLATREKWTRVTHLMATEYLNYEDGKFSKSRGVGVFGDQARDTGIASDVWRFYLFYVRPESHDTSFSWVDLQTKNNSELLNNLGNFVNRALKFVYQFYKGVIPAASPTEADFRVMAAVNQELERYTKALAACRLRDGIRRLLAITQLGNQYIQENEPFKLIKANRSEEDKKRGATVINVSVNIVALVSILLHPYMPDTSKRISQILNLPEPTFNVLPKAFKRFFKSGHTIQEPSPLIRKITDEEITELKKKFAGVASTNSSPPKKSASRDVSQMKENKPPKANPEEAQRLEELVSQQGLKVRDLKGQGAGKEVLAPEIERLLQLKESLALAQGLDPATVRGGGKKKKK